MKAGIFDPYLDTVGGGERYCLTVAEALLKKGWEVDVFWPNDFLRTKLVEKFSLSIARVNFVPYSPWNNNLFKRCNYERKYDLLFYLSDGSLPLMFGRKNILHFQVPFKNTLRQNCLSRLKLKGIDLVVCNSYFTKKTIDESLGINSLVVYPPVEVESFKPLKKENLILAVGRFSQLLQGKRQDVLVDVFGQMIKTGGGKSWKLVLAGGSEIGGKDYVEELRKKSAGLPIEIIENPPFSELVKFYGRAKIFWTASGYGVDEEKEPEKAEHFGMTTVEAMAAGCVPVVMGKGGQKEIVEDGKNGFWWTEKDQLSQKTLDLIKNEKQLAQLSENAIIRSKNFSKEIFNQKIYGLI